MKNIFPSAQELTVLFFLFAVGPVSPIFLNLSQATDADIRGHTIWEKARLGVSNPVSGSQLYWDHGLHWESKEQNATLKLGGKFAVDTGNINADAELNRAFPGLEGSDTDIRTATLSASGRLFNAVDYKLEIDLAHSNEVQDNWIQFKKIPLLGYLQIGHMKEPFSLERETSFNYLTFMENSLPTQTFPAGRNLGAMVYNTALDERITWKVGGFYNTGSFSNVGDPQDQISTANGYDITARLTGRPWYSDGGRKLLHLGLSFSRRYRDGDFEDPDNRSRFSTQPETRLTNQRLADTGKFVSNGIDVINPEFAIVSGPFSLQGEYFYAFVDTAKTLRFFGFYIYSSYFITGEHRLYDALKSTFTGIVPKHDFKPFQNQWGAWELAARVSYIDLNDGPIAGGEETNFTAGVNGYLRSNARVMINYIRADLKNREDPLVDHGSADIIQMRLHIFF